MGRYRGGFLRGLLLTIPDFPTRFLASLKRIADDQITALPSWNASLHDNKIVLGIHFHNLKIMDANLFIPHVTGEPFAFAHFFSCAASGFRADRTRDAAEHGTVAFAGAPFIVQTLDDPLKTLTDRNPFDVDILPDFKIIGSKFAADLQVLDILGTDFPDKIACWNVRFFKYPQPGLFELFL